MQKTPQTTGFGDGGQAQSRARTITDKTHEAEAIVRNAAHDRAESARRRAEGAKEQAADRVRKVGSAVRKIVEQLQDDEQQYIARPAARAGDRLDQLADYISGAQLGTLVRDAEKVARDKPALFFGGAFVLGLAAGRLLKGSGIGDSSDAEQDSYTSAGDARRENDQ